MYELNGWRFVIGLGEISEIIQHLLLSKLILLLIVVVIELEQRGPMCIS